MVVPLFCCFVVWLFGSMVVWLCDSSTVVSLFRCFAACLFGCLIVVARLYGGFVIVSLFRCLVIRWARCFAVSLFGSIFYWLFGSCVIVSLFRTCKTVKLCHYWLGLCRQVARRPLVTMTFLLHPVLFIIIGIYMIIILINPYLDRLDTFVVDRRVIYGIV